MTAIAVAIMSVHDADKYREYAMQTPEMVRRHGGRFLTRGEPVTCLEGTTCEGRVVVSEWPSKAAAEAFFSDPDYLAVAALRKEASMMTLLIVQDGVADEVAPDPHV